MVPSRATQRLSSVGREGTHTMSPYSVFKCSFDEFVGEKMVSSSYSFTILGLSNPRVFLISVIVLFVSACLLFNSSRTLLIDSCIFSIFFSRFLIIFTIIILNSFSGSLLISSSFVWTYVFLVCSFICLVFLYLFIIFFNLLCLGSLFLRLQGWIWRRQWRGLVGYSPWGLEESDTAERLHFPFSLSCIGQGNVNPLQCSCLENPRDRGAWWAANYGVAQSQTWLTRLSSSSSSKVEFFLLCGFCPPKVGPVVCVSFIEGEICAEFLFVCFSSGGQGWVRSSSCLLMFGFVFLFYLLFRWGVLHRVLLVVGWCQVWYSSSFPHVRFYYLILPRISSLVV